MKRRSLAYGVRPATCGCRAVAARIVLQGPFLGSRRRPVGADVRPVCGREKGGCQAGQLFGGGADRGHAARRDGAAWSGVRYLPRAQSEAGLRTHDGLGPAWAHGTGCRPRQQLHLRVGRPVLQRDRGRAAIIGIRAYPGRPSIRVRHSSFDRGLTVPAKTRGRDGKCSVVPCSMAWARSGASVVKRSACVALSARAFHTRNGWQRSRPDQPAVVMATSLKQADLAEVAARLVPQPSDQACSVTINICGRECGQLAAISPT